MRFFSSILGSAKSAEFSFRNRNYLFDQDNSLDSLRRLFGEVFGALAPQGIFVFDVAEPGRGAGFQRACTEGEGWTCLVEYEYDRMQQQLTRRIITFRQIGSAYRRHQETHRQQLYRGTTMARILREIGFRVRLVRRYGEYALPKHGVGIIARKP